MEDTTGIFEGYIEMVAGSDIKYVFNEREGKLKVQRKTALPLPEPFNYGFIKGTMSQDGDPLDVFVISGSRIELGSTVRIKPIGVLYVDDEMGRDNKVIAVDLSDGASARIEDISDIEPERIEGMKRLLEHNKDGMKGKWTRVNGQAGREEALKEIIDSSKEG